MVQPGEKLQRRRLRWQPSPGDVQLIKRTPMQFDDAANGSEVELSAGDQFELSLRETRTAGYRWTFKSSGEPSCILLGESSQPVSARAGGTGTHLWRFRAVAPGNCLLALEYKRSWESSSEPARIFGMKVRVRP